MLLFCREAVQAQPSSTSSMESEDAWFNDEPQQRSSGETSTSGRVESDLEFLELPKAQNVRCLLSITGALNAQLPGSNSAVALEIRLNTLLSTQVRVKKAEFVKSSTNMAQCPKSKLPEFAVIGRSNVGKSSLINMLTGQAALAKVSKTPGSCSTCSQPHPVLLLVWKSVTGNSGVLHMLIVCAGKTIYINHFLINDNWYLVDLPGYG